jgi:sulfatase maturation enzyme AslB (radical SAM superfamily)
MAALPMTSSRPGFHVMAKPTGPICNLGCRCCFYFKKERLYPGTAASAMSAWWGCRSTAREDCTTAIEWTAAASPRSIGS